MSSAVDLKATEGKFWLYLCIFLALQERNIKRTLKSFPIAPVLQCPSWTVIRQICEIFDDFFVFHCAALLCFIIVIYVIIVKFEVITSLNTLCYVPLLLCNNSNPYACEDTCLFFREYVNYEMSEQRLVNLLF